MRCNFALWILLACAVVTPACAKAQAAPAQASGPAAISTPLLYRNTQYGFCFRLPASWKGYTVLTQQWSATQESDGTKKMSGPLLRIRHPKWTEANDYEDIPIMIFTSAQWQVADDYIFSAAPIGPGDIGHNAKYVFALPPRYDFDMATGWEEVDQLIKQHSLQAPCGRAAAQPAK